MTELLPPVGWADVARRSDVEHLEPVMVSSDDLREQTNRFIGWMVANNAVLIGAVTLIVTLSH